MVALRGAPTDYVVREVLESAVRLARRALQGVGVSRDQIDRAEDIYRDRDRERLAKQIETGDYRAAHDQIITQVERR
jgi:CPA2 family monovalent cation:H+ antiporter-2/glutathione-regulated potassium-efflux system protein KefB